MDAYLEGLRTMDSMQKRPEEMVCSAFGFKYFWYLRNYLCFLRRKEALGGHQSDFRQNGSVREITLEKGTQIK